jgi:DNA polymerase IV
MPLPAPAARIVHLDVDAFFASIEQRDDPALRGRPVAVGSGVVASSSYEAKRHGVRTGMSLAEARSLCRALRVLPGDYRRYEQAGRRILAICLDRTDKVEVPALDDLYLDLTPPHGMAFPSDIDCRQAVAVLRRQIRAEVELSVSAGIGSSKLIAAVATDQAKQRPLPPNQDALSALHAEPGAIVVVPAGSERDYLAPWPVEILPGVGPRFLAQLQRLNVQRVGEVTAMPVAVLSALFGARGRALHQLAHGIDPRPVQPHRPPQSISRRTSFEPPAADPGFCQAMLEHLLDRAVSWLRFHGLAARGLTVALRYGDYQSADGRTSFRQATSDEQLLKEAARDRFRRLLTRRLPLRLL